VNRSFGNRGNGLDDELRAAAPQADQSFVRSLADELGASHPAHRSSRLAFAGAVAVITVGALASFGGVSYAASSATNAATAVKNAVTHKTSAQGQYDSEAPVQPASAVKSKVVKLKAKPATATAAIKSSGTLPFTGFSLIGTLALGGALVGIGIMLRRRESRE
jgi:hypothetical protein